MSQQGASIDVNRACIPSNYSRLMAQELGLQARELPQLLTMTGLTTEQFLRYDTLLTSLQQVQILQNAIRLSNDGLFGLHLGRRFTPATHGILGLLVNSSPNFFMLMKAFQSFVPTRLYFSRLGLMTDDEYLQCTLHFDIDLPDEVLQALSECMLMAFCENAKFIIGQSLEGMNIQFMHEAPSYFQSYSDYLPGDIQFSQNHVMASVPLELCYLQNDSANRMNYALAYKQCERLIGQLHGEGTCKYQVQKMMLSAPPTAISEVDIASALFISKRTLGRRLEKEGTCFRQIRDDILSQQAISYLRESDVSIEAVANLLNYHDCANFRRAFKRWFNMTPNQYREQLQKRSVAN